jgi:hypothetical protein
MYQILLADLRADAMQAALSPNRECLGGSQDAATAFYIAADADALATRLMNCADARLSLARGAVWGDNPDALFFNPPAALNQSARALALIEKAGEAKRFSEFMLGCALTFENCDVDGVVDPDTGDDPTMNAAQEVWNTLMSEGIFDRSMYL